MMHETLPAAPAERPDLLSLRGRLSRAEFIAYSSLCAFGTSMLLSGFGYFVMLFPPGLARNWYSVAAIVAVNLILPILVASLSVRRLHDLGKPGWLAGLLVVPVANVLLVLILWAWPGSAGSNAYGEAPGPASTFVLGTAVSLPLLLIAGYLSSGPLGDEWKPAAASERAAAARAKPSLPSSSSSLRPY